jgi:hypothetical protein
MKRAKDLSNRRNSAVLDLLAEAYAPAWFPVSEIFSFFAEPGKLRDTNNNCCADRSGLTC